MKNLLFILALFLVSCSEKSEVTPEKCITCTETTFYQQSGQPSQTYVSFKEEFCNGIPSTITQGTINESGSMGGSTWKKTTTMVCK